MRSIVWVLVLIIPLALFARVVGMALTGQRKGAVRSHARADREDGSAAAPPDEDATNAPRGPF